MSEYQYLDIFQNVQILWFSLGFLLYLFLKKKRTTFCKKQTSCFLHTSPMGHILEWFPYFKTPLKQDQPYCYQVFVVWRFCDNVKVAFNVRKKSIQNFITSLLVDATLFDKNGLMLSRPVNSNSPGTSGASRQMCDRESWLFKMHVITLKEILDFALTLDYSQYRKYHETL